MDKGHRFLHNHPMTEKQLGLDENHVIVDRDAWEEARKQVLNLRISVVSCRLFDLMALNPKEYHKYTEPIYTKMDGMYGYISVSGHKVFFFWYNSGSENVCCDDVSDRFRIEYVYENGN